MDECRVEAAARGAALAAVVSGDEKPSVIEEAELFRLHHDLVVASDGPPYVASHSLGAVVAAAHVKRKSVGDVSDEVGMQQQRQRFAVCRGEGLIKLLSRRHFGVETVITTCHGPDPGSSPRHRLCDGSSMAVTRSSGSQMMVSSSSASR